MPTSRDVPGDPGLHIPQSPSEPITLHLAAGDTRSPAEALAVFVGPLASISEDTLPIAGRYARDADTLTFSPMFGFTPGNDYVIRTRRDGEPDRLTAFRLPVDTVDARVTTIYPSGDVLPENVLRFYLHFSVPMAPHLAFEYIRLRDAQGVVDDAAFMRFKQELWSEDRTRLTLLIDPGRIKRSVATNLDLGPALVEGEHYALTVEEGWPSADGTSTLPRFVKHFTVAAPLRERPSAALWQWDTPRPGTCEAFQITFDRPFDRHLLGDALQISTTEGRLIEGAVRVGKDEMSWSLTPDEPWGEDDVNVIIDDALEDVAGNNFRELLDRATFT